MKVFEVIIKENKIHCGVLDDGHSQAIVPADLADEYVCFGILKNMPPNTEAENPTWELSDLEYEAIKQLMRVYVENEGDTEEIGEIFKIAYMGGPEEFPDVSPDDFTDEGAALMPLITKIAAEGEDEEPPPLTLHSFVQAAAFFKTMFKRMIPTLSDN